MFTYEEVKKAAFFFGVNVSVFPSIELSVVIVTNYALSDREYFKKETMSPCDGH